MSADRRLYELKPIDLALDGKTFVAAMSDTYRISFGNDTLFQSWGGPDGENYLKKLKKHDQAPSAFCRAICKSGKVVGLIEAFPGEDGSFYLAFLYVEPNERRLGFGKRALADLEKWAKESGFKTLSLTVEASNIKAIKFYQAAGWKLKGSSPKSPSAMMYQLSLD